MRLFTFISDSQFKIRDGLNISEEYITHLSPMMFLRDNSVIGEPYLDLLGSNIPPPVGP